MPRPRIRGLVRVAALFVDGDVDDAGGDGVVVEAEARREVGVAVAVGVEGEGGGPKQLDGQGCRAVTLDPVDGEGAGAVTDDDFGGTIAVEVVAREPAAFDKGGDELGGGMDDVLGVGGAEGEDDADRGGDADEVRGAAEGIHGLVAADDDVVAVGELAPQLRAQDVAIRRGFGVDAGDVSFEVGRWEQLADGLDGRER